MVLKEIRSIAKEAGIASPYKFKKAALIKAIQQAENNVPCYATCNGNCQETSCLWYSDCIKEK
jgi:hypothetical protein